MNHGLVESHAERVPKLHRRRFLACMASSAVAAPVFAQPSAWPTRPIKLVIGYSPGGTGDGVARPVVEGLERSLKQPIVMDYKPGASGLIAADYLAKAPADGYTIHMSDNGALSIGPATRKLGYDPAAFTYLGSPGGLPLVLICSPKLPVTTLPELVAYVKSHPGTIDYATGGVGGLPHLIAEQFKGLIHSDITHVPYKGLGAALPDLISGRVAFGFFGSIGVLGHVKSGSVRALAVTSARRISQLPDVPTTAEGGFPQIDSTYQSAIIAPPGLPPQVEAQLAAAVQQLTRDPQVVAGLEAGGFSIAPLSPAATKKLFQQELLKWKALIVANKLNLNE
ncbi:tripartite tricarboxylate transporter substrate binding protein [Variovorax sp. KK3]|uniref:Bug family tripartite tricarboxylate transporter substrate binding protein n=1 Tax=Variovorax sp. KK3 TaxID=1855728 RepID=UPI00097CBBDD|nr:tripartite tricarboxylate transporter substrate binding protein [Variovorax sp. KK3]